MIKIISTLKTRTQIAKNLLVVWALFSVSLYSTSAHTLQMDTSIPHKVRGLIDQDMVTLARIGGTFQDKDLRRFFGGSYRGSDMLEWFLSYGTVVVHQSFQPKFCINKPTINPRDLPPQSVPLYKAYIEGTVADCEDPEGFSKTASIKRLYRSNDILGLVYTAKLNLFFEEKGLEGGIYFLDGNIAPQQTPDRSFLIISSDYGFFTGFPESKEATVNNRAAQLIRSASLLGELYRIKKASEHSRWEVEKKCSFFHSKPPGICTKLTNSVIAFKALLLQDFARNCPDCGNHEKLAILHKAADFHSRVVGSSKHYRSAKKIMTKHEDEMKKLGFDTYTIKQQYRYSLLES